MLDVERSTAIRLAYEAGRIAVAAASRSLEVKKKGADLGPVITDVRSPTLLIVGERDTTVLGLNRRAYAQLRVVDKELAVVPGATHLFEEPGALEEVNRLAAEWFVRHLGSS